MRANFYKLFFMLQLMLLIGGTSFGQTTITFTGVAPVDEEYIGSQNLDVAVGGKTLRFHYNNASPSGAQGGPNYYMSDDGTATNDGTGTNVGNRGLVINEQNTSDALTIGYTDNSAFSFNSFKVIDFNVFYEAIFPGAGGPAHPLTITAFNGATQVATLNFTYTYSSADNRKLVNTLAAATAFNNVTSIVITAPNVAGPGFYHLFDDVVIGAAVLAPTITITPATLPSATAGTAYSQTITGSGGTAPYTFAVTSGALPTGLSLSATGTISGTPTGIGTFNFTVTATDNGSFTGTRTYALTVSAPTITISPTTLAAAAQGNAYSQTITASGGTAPYTYAVTGGALPAGLTLSTAGVLSGTPTVNGTFNFTLTATDNATGTGAPFSGSRAYSLTVSGPTITAGGGPLTAMTTVYGTASTPAQSFTVSGTSLSTTILISPADAAFEISTNNGVSYTPTGTLTPVSGTVPATTILVRLAATATAGNHSGNIVLSSTGATAVNVATATSVVSPAPLTITANPQTKVYAAAVPSLTATYTGFVNGDTNANLTTQPTLSTTATVASSVAGSPYAITAAGAVSSNYNISYVPGTLSVTAAPLTITADNQTKAYGAGLPTLTASYTGFVNGDTNASLTTQPTLSTTATAASSVAGSPYAITASGAVSSNYNISYLPGALSITTAPLIITADNQTKAYGAAVPTLTANYTGFVNGDTNASLTTQPTLSTTATAASSVAGNPYAITAAGAVSSNYSISYAPGTLSVTAAPLTITADNQTKAYGAAVPSLTVSYTGFVNGDTNASLTTQPSLSTTATAASSVAGNPYAITATGAVSPNYTISYVPGTLSVTAAPLTITADNQTKVYGAGLPPLTASYTGLVNGDTNASLTTQPTLSTTATAASSVAGSPYAITASGAASTNYTISYVPGTLSITTAPLIITADNQTKAYGAGLPTLTANYTGFVNGDSNASLTTQPTLSTTATAASSVAGSPYAITAAGAASSNYSISYASGILTIGAVPLTITADNQTKAYGAAIPALTASYTGFVNGDTNASLTTQPTLSTTATAASSVAGSPYAITPSGAASSNYTISYVPGTLSITTAPLTITADNQTKVYGAAIPELTASYSGFVNGDTNASLTTPPSLSTTATAASSVAGSPYAITAAGAASSNYTISYVPGTLSVTAAPLTITADNQTKAYGAAIPELTASYTGFVNGDTNASLTTPPSLTTTATAASSVAGSPYSITATGAASSNYTINYVPGTLTIGAVPLTITADNQTKAYGAAIPALTASYTGFVNGDTNANLTTQPSLSTTATAASSVAGSPYPITATGAASSNYSISYVPGTLTIGAVPLTITADNQTKAYGAAVPPLTASYIGFVNGDTNASLTTQPSLSTTATAASSVAGSPYVITASEAASSNYTISYVPGTLTIGTAPLTIIADNQTKAYGAAVPPLTASYSGFVNGDTNANLTTQPALSTTATAASSVAGSPYAITASGAASSNYTISYAPGTLTIGAVPLTITADNQTKAYGAAVPPLTASYSGFVNGDTNASLTTQPSLSTTATAASSVTGSPYAITATGAASSNYTISYAPGTLTVGAVPLTITADNQTKAYGAAVPPLTASYTGFVNGDTNASLTTQPSLSTTATAASSVAGSPYPITATGAASTNYTINYITGALTITNPVLTITANDQSKTYGAVNPTLTVSYSGFVNGEGVANFTTLPSVTTTAVAGSGANTYPITVSGAVIANYSVVYVPGTLTVNKAGLTVTADNKSRNFAVANPPLTVTYSGFVNGDTNASLSTQATASTTATLLSLPGNYPITPSGAASPNYTFNYVNGTLSIAPLTLATLSNLTISAGELLPVFTSAVHEYTTAVDYSVNTISLTPTFESTASIKIDGVTVNNGSSSSGIVLRPGNNMISVVVTAQDGTSTNTYTVTVYRGLPPTNITATNILTPNGDGKNDTWVIQDIELYPKNKVSVFDRAGRVVYQKNGYTNDWDGTLNGAPLTEGTYYYNVDLGPGLPKFKGFITILRSN